MKKIITFIPSYRKHILSFPIRKSERSRWCVSWGARNSTEAPHHLRQGESAQQPAGPKEGQNPPSPSTAFVGVLVLWQWEQALLGDGIFISAAPKPWVKFPLWEENWCLPRQLLPQGGMDCWNGKKYLKLWQAVFKHSLVFSVKTCSLGEWGSCLTRAAHYFSHLCLAQMCFLMGYGLETGSLGMKPLHLPSSSELAQKRGK